MNLEEVFREHLRQPDVSAAVLALDIARAVRPSLKPAHYLAEIDRLAEFTGRRLAPNLVGRAVAVRLLEIFNGELAFEGNQSDYYDPRNSLLDQVLERRTGLPIMLSLLCMEIGRRLGIQVDGLGFPSHFMARYTDVHGAWLLDPFHGAVIEIEESDAYLSKVVGRPVQVAAAFYWPVAAVDLAARILNNLRAAYMTHSAPEALLRVLGLQLVMSPAEASLWRERAVLQYHIQSWDEASRDLRRYLFLLGALPYLFPEDARSIYDLPSLGSDDRNLLMMHRRIGEILNRLN